MQTETEDTGLERRMWTPDEIATARANLSAYAAYRPLLDKVDTPMWGVKELAEFLTNTGIRPRTSREQIQTWCDSRTRDGRAAFPGAIRYEGNVGWRIPHEDVIAFFGLGIVNQLETAAS